MEKSINSGKKVFIINSILLFLRLTIVFAIVFVLGYHSSSHKFNSSFTVIDFTSSIIDVNSFWESIFHSTISEYCILILVGTSAITFFCPFTVHVLTAIAGFSYGAGFKATLSSQTKNIHYSVYILFTVFFAFLFLYWATYSIKANRGFISAIGKRDKSTYIFVSKDFRIFIFKLINLLFIVTLTRALYVFLLLII